MVVAASRGLREGGDNRDEGLPGALRVVWGSCIARLGLLSTGTDSNSSPNEVTNTINQLSAVADPMISTRVRKMPKYLADFKL